MIPTVVFDLDGTLLDLTGIREWAKGERSDYDEFQKVAPHAPPISWVVSQTLSLSHQGFDIVVMTARDARCWTPTAQWLERHNVMFTKLVMRPNGDTFSDFTVKAGMVAALVSQGHDVRLAFEDNPDLVKLWRGLDVPCVVVPGWEEG